MSLIKIAKFCVSYRLQVRCYSITNQTNLVDFDFTPKFSQEEQEKILNTLNNPDKDVLLSLNVPKVKIKNMENYRNKKGPFKSLHEVLEVDGLGVKLLEKLCEQIITNTPNNAVRNVSVNKRYKQLLEPTLSTDKILNISNSVGIHLTPIGLSWAKLSTGKLHVNSWGFENFETLPKKMLTTETFKLAVQLLEKIPEGDLYVFEGASQGMLGKTQTTTYTQQLELTSMLLALINTSSKHNPHFQKDNIDEENFNRVHFLKSNVPARLFKTWVGNEKVSTISTISQIIDRTGCSLPCSQITLDEQLKTEYLDQSSTNKELLGQALMLVLAFTEICIHKNIVSINALTSRKNK